MFFIIVGLIFLGAGIYVDVKYEYPGIASIAYVAASIAIIFGLIFSVFSTTPEEARCKSLDGQYSNGKCFVLGKEV